jgi:cellulose synthase/poly-beta-1,6-N-acetylglucosamine synthase-like glycosyltransferase
MSQKKNTWPPASIIIASYNNYNTLTKVLNKMLKLDYPKYEINIVYDGDIKGAKEIIDKFKKYKIIHHHINKKNLGVCKTRNKGIELSKYNFIVNMDHDCIPKKDWLKKIMSGFDNPKIGVVSSYAKYGGTSTAFRKELLKKVGGGYDLDYGYYREDTDLSFKIMDLGHEFKLVKADFEHNHKEARPKGINGLFKYLIQRLKYHQNDVLLYKKHPTKLCQDFLKIKYGFLVSPYADFSVATGLWQGKFNLSSPRGLVFMKSDKLWKKVIIVFIGITYILLVKFSRLIGSIKHKKLLI